MGKRVSHIGETELKPISIEVDGHQRVFDIGDPDLPDWVKDHVMTAGGYPYDDKLDRKAYDKTLEDLQEELVKLQTWMQKTGHRAMLLFEGRDAAGKGGSIAAFRQFLNPRNARNVALSKPTEIERQQWYFQRYVLHFPTAGELVTFDRSWYNRAVVEPVMGFCTTPEYLKFVDDVPDFERMIVDEGIHLFKFWLNIGQETQLKRFHDRVHSSLKYWKFSPIDIAGITKWDAYTQHRDAMLEKTHSKHAPWTVVRANDKRRARIEIIRHVLRTIDFPERDAEKIGEPDEKIICSGAEFIERLDNA